MLLLLIVSAISAFSQTDTPGNEGVKKVSVASFTKVKLDANIDVLLFQDDQDGPVFVEGDRRYLNEISFTVKNGELRISSSVHAGIKARSLLAFLYTSLTSLR